MLCSRMCAGPGEHVNFNEAPSAAELKGWDPASRGQGAQRDGVQAKGRCGLGDSQQFFTHFFLPNAFTPRCATTGTARIAAHGLSRPLACVLLAEATVVLWQCENSSFANTVGLITVIP